MRVAFPTDEHHPFADEKAREVALKIVQDFDPELLVAGSDALDFYTISHFDKNPARVKMTLQTEIDTWKRAQREWIDAAPNAVVKFIQGNHEDRHRRLLWSNPSLSALDALQLPNLLELAAFNIEWEYSKGEAANQEIVLFDKLVIKHGKFVRSQSAYSAKAEVEFERYSLSSATGHTHRGGVYYTRTRQGIVQAAECFCLCSLEPEYVRFPDWQQGIMLINVDEDGVSFEPVPINSFRSRKRAVWRGKEYLSG